MIKKTFNQIFSNNTDILNKLDISLDLRPQNLTPETYYKLTIEFLTGMATCLLSGLSGQRVAFWALGKPRLQGFSSSAGLELDPH